MKRKNLPVQWQKSPVLGCECAASALFRKKNAAMHICLILFPGFPILAYSLICDVVRLANCDAGQPLFSLEIRGVIDRHAKSREGLEVTGHDVDWNGGPGFDLVLLCAGNDPLDHLPMGLRRFLHQADSSGATLAGVDGGAMVLARLGLLAGREAVVDPSSEPDFDEKFPDIALCDRNFSFDRNRLTTTGGLAVADALLAWIGRVRTPQMASDVAKALERGHLRNIADSISGIEKADPILEQMQAIMTTHLQDPLPLDRIAADLNLSLKQLRRRCRKGLGKTPAQIYMSLRLNRAQQLVQETALPVNDVAKATGFASPSAFTRSYKATFHHAPRTVRAAQ